jgi:hypothetical protein
MNKNGYVTSIRAGRNSFIKGVKMTWRNHNNHREETKAVKEALLKAGYTHVRVNHGTGTAWAWLLIQCDPKPGQSYQDKRIEVLRVAKEVTGRYGDYDGDINVF